MYITSKYSGYNRHGEQTAAGKFLILMQPKAPEGMRAADAVHYETSAPIRAIVRYVRMRQFGNFMMGTARIGKHRVTLSGSYGSDGLPCTVPQEAYEMGVEVPAHLIEMWNKGGGWNSAGNEATEMRKWALESFGR